GRVSHSATLEPLLDGHPDAPARRLRPRGRRRPISDRPLVLDVLVPSRPALRAAPIPASLTRIRPAGQPPLAGPLHRLRPGPRRARLPDLGRADRGPSTGRG